MSPSPKRDITPADVQKVLSWHYLATVSPLLVKEA
jgi:hypothetical protein